MTLNAAALERHIQSIPDLAKLTPDAVGAALDGFPLPLPNIDWLARALQGALYVARTPDDQDPARQSNTDTRDDLNRLARKLAKVWDELGERNIDAAILDYAHRGGEMFGEADDYRQFKEAQAGLEWLGVFLRRTGMMLDAQGRGWRLRAQRDARIMEARCLAIVYEQAFDKKPTAHSRPTKSPLPWPDFFQRIMAAAYGEAGTSDLVPMLAEALELEAAYPLSIAEKFWPDKPCD